MSTAFDEILTILGDVDQEITADRVTGLSDLDPDELSRFSTVWENLPVERRRSLIQLLGEEAHAHVELNFDRVCRLALGDSDPAVRQMAIDNLWECEDPALAILFLRALGSDVSAAVRRSAAAALGQYVLLGEVDRSSQRPFLTLNLIGVISAGLAVANLLPFPALDGGRLMFVAIEAVIGRRVSPRYEGLAHAIGFAILLALMVYVNFQDFVNPIVLPR